MPPKRRTLMKNIMDPDSGRSFVVPRPERADKAFEAAKVLCEEKRISVYNATPGSKLDVFEKIDFDLLF